MGVVRSGQAGWRAGSTPGALVPLHDHPGSEELDYLYTPPDGRHAASALAGGVVLVTTPKPVRMLDARA